MFLNNNTHKLYLSEQDTTIIEQKKNKNMKNVFIYSIELIFTGILLFLIGDLLGDTLNVLCNLLKVPQKIIGILLGIITSIPEFITFLESQRYYNDDENDIIGVIEATNNLLASNTLNLFIIQTIGILIVNIS